MGILPASYMLRDYQRKLLRKQEVLKKKEVHLTTQISKLNAYSDELGIVQTKDRNNEYE